MRHYIPLGLWLSWTVEERAAVEQDFSNRGVAWGIDLDDLSGLKLAEPIIGEFEEYLGEADSRGVDESGYNKDFSRR